jgi:D-glycero-alpha-D-manno-heptose 1-phosphate guanylyltransferase
MQVIILAGSFGTRLQAVVPDLPKPMGPVAPRQR